MSQPYYKVYPLTDNIYHIFEPGMTGSTLIIGHDRALLIDTGYGFADLKSVVEGLTDRPLTVVNTHGHLDHTGGNYLFDRVLINYAELPVYYWYQSVEKPAILEKFKKDYAGRLDEIFSAGFDVAAYLGRTSKSIAQLVNHQRFDLGGSVIEAIYLPGHTKGSVVFFDWDSKICFAGDNIGRSVWLQLAHRAPLETYLAGLEMIRQYPVKYVLHSHETTLLPACVIDFDLLAVWHRQPETDKEFIHPRTGQRAKMHKELVEAGEGLTKVYILYPEVDESE